MTGWFWTSPEVSVFRSLHEIPPDLLPCALTIGNFDGFHLGHRELVRRAVRIARDNGWRSRAMTFDPHPARIIAPERSPRVMTTPDERARAMQSAGIDDVMILPFDEATAQLSAAFFVRHILSDTLRAKAIVVGDDFRFGHKHLGDASLLAALSKELGFTTDFVAPVLFRGKRVSSSRIRSLVEAGRLGPACRLLGAPFSLEGPVVSGHGIGRKQTVPTLNLAPHGEVLPKCGVYVSRTADTVSGQHWRSVTNVGIRPTFSGDSLTIETYLLGPVEQTPARIRVEFLARIRSERKFTSPEALKTRILLDVASAQRYFRHAPPDAIIE